MTAKNTTSSVVSAVLPRETASKVTTALRDKMNVGALCWDSRGTLLQDQWWKRWVPPISPAKASLQMLAPSHEVEAIERTIIEAARLDKQSTGAVFSTPCTQTLFGAQFDAWQAAHNVSQDTATANLRENLSAIYCLVSHQDSDRVSKAAINAGAHGPIVYYCEGRGLRDRLGWLRITKEHEKEVLLVIAEEDDTDTIFDAMAKAGNLHLPGRGFMYSVPVSKGMFNLQSRVAHHHHDASMQQIISAIDHMAGHNHWRDGSVIDVGGSGRAAGLQGLSPVVQLNNQVCLSVISHRDDSSAMIEMMLDAGAPGLNFHYARFSEGHANEQLVGAHMKDEYAVIRCVTHAETAASVCASLENASASTGTTNFCAFVLDAPRVATYVPGRKDFRAA